MIVMVDGDNAPGENVSGLNELEADDKVIIYYASNNKYFLDVRNRERLDHNAECALEFMKINCGSCAVDFAVAMDLAVLVSREPEGNVALVSKDKHFGIIGEHAREINNKWCIVQAPTIHYVVKHYKVIESRTLAELQKYLQKMFGDKHGKAFYQGLQIMFQEQYKRQASKTEMRISDKEVEESRWPSRKKTVLRWIISHISIWRRPVIPAGN